MERGQIWWFIPSYAQSGSIQSGKRPVIIVSNRLMNKHSPIVLAVPCTAKKKKMLPTHIYFNIKGRDNVALCEQVRPVNITDLGDYVGKCSEDVIQRVDKALIVAFELDYLLPKQKFRNKWGAAITLFLAKFCYIFKKNKQPLKVI